MNNSFLKKIDKFVCLLLNGFPVNTSGGKVSSIDDENLKNVLFIRPGGIGDAVYLIPILRYLKQKFPQLHIDILAENRNGSVFNLCSQVDHIYLYDRPVDLLNLLFKKYDVIFDSEQWHCISAVVAKILRSSIKVGFDTNVRGRMFTHPVKYNQDDPEIKSFYRLLSPLGFCEGGTGIDAPFLEISETALNKVDRLLENVVKPFVCLFPGASIPERRWGGENIRHLAASLIGKVGVVVVGGKGDREEGEAISRVPGVVDFTGKTTLVETAAIISRSSMLVSGDSGMLHIAVGLDTPTVSLFGPGISLKWAPKGEKHIVLDRQLDCSPCTQFGYTPSCPIGARCIRGISVEEVLSAVNMQLKLLKK